MKELNEIRVEDWLERLLARGSYGFALRILEKELPDYTPTAIKRALSRLTKKGKIVSIYKGYYVILPPQYALKGILPPALFLDAFMSYLKRPYYVSLLSAAALHGASHQQPQEYFVLTNFPVLRPMQKKGLKINYISIRQIPNILLEKRKTEAGYITISNAILTACDLIQFEKRIGGLNRAAAVLSELIESIRPSDFTPELLHHSHSTALQRLGFILEQVCHNHLLADVLFSAMAEEGLLLFRIPLKPAAETRGYSSENRWKVIVNTSIEIDE
ncbi:MAG: type IV toxin-antitoxin system AbiEi family antitoxin [Bacteroidia bacterium]